MRYRHLTVACAVGAAALAAFAAGTLQQGQVQKSECEKIVKERSEVQKRMSEMDERMDRLLDELQDTEDENERIELLVETVQAMDEQRRMRQEAMASIHDQIMSHISGHVMEGMPEEQRAHMQSCPLMQQMKGGHAETGGG